MTDRLRGCTVSFIKDIREDDAEALLNAIQMLKGVLAVEPSLSTADDWVAQQRVRHELGRKLLEVIYPEHYKDETA